MPADRAGSSYLPFGQRMQAICVALMVGCSWCATTEATLPPQTVAEVARGAKEGLVGTGPSKQTLRRWLEHYLAFGELPHVTKSYEEKLGLHSRRTARKITPAVLRSLRRAVKDHPEVSHQRATEQSPPMLSVHTTDSRFRPR